MKRSLISCFLLTFVALLAFAAIPQDYYGAADGKRGEALLDALHGIIDNHTSISYSNLEPYYAKTDLDKNGRIWDMYSTCSFDAEDVNCQQKHVCDCWNKEHSIPQSYFNEASPMKSDLFHVYPTDARVNNFRSNYPFGETNSTSYIDGDKKALGKIGNCSFSGYSGVVYEPDDQYKGDFARTYFYMVTRYLDKNFTQAANGKVTFTYSNGRAGLTTFGINLLLKWHRQDPVSQKEIDRNNAVYGIQNNRNPFIDYPYLAEYIWGKEKGSQVSFATNLMSSENSSFVPDVSDGNMKGVIPLLITSCQQIGLPAILLGESSSQQFTVTNANFSANIQASISGQNADVFSISPSYISAPSANSRTEFTLSFTPQAVGSYNATITISADGVEPLVIPISASCAEQCRVSWKNNGQDYYDGNPTTVVAFGGRVAQIPLAPKSIDPVSAQFVGWTAYAIADSIDEVPADLFSDASDAPLVTADVTYHAVFARITSVEGTAPASSSVTFSNLYSSNTTVGCIDVGSTKVKFEKASASNASKYYTSGKAIRCYAKSRINVIGNNISKISFTFGSDDGNTITASVGGYSNGAWVGQADSVSFSIGGTSGHRKITSISIDAQAKAQVYGYSRYITHTIEHITALPDNNAEKIPSGRKYLKNGELLIEVNGRHYDMLGIIKRISL